MRSRLIGSNANLRFRSQTSVADAKAVANPVRASEAHKRFLPNPIDNQ